MRPIVLVVDDDDALRDTLVKHFCRSGYDVVEARDGLEAWDVALAEDGDIRAVVADVLMPRLGGAELARRLLENWPKLQVLLVSGAFTASEVEVAGGLAGVHFLEKPFTPSQVERRVREMLGERSTTASLPRFMPIAD